jgi:hypothetical protein
VSHVTVSVHAEVPDQVTVADLREYGDDVAVQFGDDLRGVRLLGRLDEVRSLIARALEALAEVDRDL